MKKALADPRWRSASRAPASCPYGGTPEAMAASVKQDLPRFQTLVKSIGIKPE